MVAPGRNPDQRSFRHRKPATRQEQHATAPIHEMQLELVVKMPFLRRVPPPSGVIIEEEQSLDFPGKVPLGERLPPHHMK